MGEHTATVTIIEGGRLMEPPGDDERFWTYPPMKRVEVREMLPPGMTWTIDPDDQGYGYGSGTFNPSDEPVELTRHEYEPAGLPEAPWRVGAPAVSFQTKSRHDGTLIFTFASMEMLGRVAGKWLADHPGWGVCQSGVFLDPLEIPPGGNPWHQLQETAFVTLAPIEGDES